MASIFHSLISTEKARELASENIRIERGSEEVPLDSCAGRVLSGDIFSPINSPPFNRAIKDGFAVRSMDVEDAGDKSPVPLAIKGMVSIGSPPGVKVTEGTCARVPTGGMMPEGADAVVMVEYTSESAGKALIFRSAGMGENIALAGSDMPRGELVARRGTAIGPRELAVLSALGISSVPVYRKVSIGIFSTGDELAQPGSALGNGMIYESNGRSIKALIEQSGPSLKAEFLGTLPDNWETMSSRISRCADEHDITVISGSTSAGEKDMVYRILGEYEPGIIFHGVGIKPGKPTLLSMKGNKVIIGLPGFPVSAMMTFMHIFLPYVLREAGIRENEHYADAVMAGRVGLDLGKLNLIPVTLSTRGEIAAFPVYGGSGSISRLLRADGYISVKGESRTLDQGEKVSVRLFHALPPVDSIVIAGEHDPLLDRIQGEHPEDVRVIKTGQRWALNSLVMGYSHAAGIISSSMEPDISRMIPDGAGDVMEVVASRELELGIAHRDSGEKTLSSLISSGSGLAVPDRADGITPVLMEVLEKEGISRDDLDRASTGAGNSNSVAYAVKEGYFPCGITGRESAHAYGLGFTPLVKYYYHIICRKEDAGKVSILRDVR